MLFARRKQLLNFYSPPTPARIRDGSGDLPKENPQTYPQDLWITAWLHFC